MRVTMKQIAERARVSRGAVSAVLNNIPGIRISAETSARILQIAEELNYRPDFAATALKTGKTGLLGFLCGGLTLPFFAELADSLMEAANRKGYQLMMMPISWKQHNDMECLLKMLDMADGIFMSSRLLDETVESRRIIMERQMPLVLMNCKSGGVSSVSFDFHVGMNKAFQILIQNGHREIAYAGEHDDTRKREAYQDCCRKYDLVPVEYIYDLNADNESLIECGTEIARNRHRHSAVIASDYGLSIMIHGFDLTGLRIPDDLSLLVFAGKTTPVRLFRPPLSSVELDCEVMVRHGMELMERLMSPSEIPPVENVIIQPEIVMRRSIRNLLDHQ